MLVFSRRKDDRVVFPSLGIDIKVLRIAGNVVRLGISAPREVPVFRDEVMTERDANQQPAPLLNRQLTHEIRNQVNSAMIALCLLGRKLDLGEDVDLEPTLYKILLDLEEIESELDRLDGSEPHPATKRLRALLVEDNANEAELLAGFLRTCDFDVDTASDGQAALEYLSSHDSPEMVLLDMTMPGLDGPATVQRIRQNPATRNLKVFALTGLSPDEAQVSIGPDGVDQWFRKPINPLQLVSELRGGATAVA